MDMIKQLSLAGLVPVIAVNDAQDAIPLCKALSDGGLPVAEITFRTSAAEEAIRLVHEQLPDVILGAGTVLTCEQVDRAIAAGATYIVSPGLNPDVVKHCIEKGIPVVPGCGNPSDIEVALSLGLKTVKFFPAEALGGLKLIKAIAAPYVDVTFMPTGGINEKNLVEYLSFKKIVACGGSWMVKDDLIKAGEFDKIEALTREAVEQMLGFELAHVGINETDEEAADKTAGRFESIFGLEKKTGSGSVFAGTAVEVMKTPGLGAKGHIGIRTNYIDRAVNYLENQGVEFNPSSAKYDDKGNLKAIYLKEEIGGFAVHLVQK